MKKKNIKNCITRKNSFIDKINISKCRIRYKAHQLIDRSYVVASALLVFVIPLLSVLFLSGCMHSFSVKEHQPYSIIGNSSITVNITNGWESSNDGLGWQNGKAYLRPATNYGLKQGEDPRYLKLIKEAHVHDNSFSFAKLPPGKWLLNLSISMKRWIKAEDFVKESVGINSRIMADGGTISSKLGTFQYMSGLWFLNGRLLVDGEYLKEKKISKKIILDEGEHKNVDAHGHARLYSY